MGAGLYDATLGRLYGHDARTAIATLTLFGGFASTACWPLLAFLASEFGWRGACLVYAAVHLVIVLPFYVFLLPREVRRPVTTGVSHGEQMSDKPARSLAPEGSEWSSRCLLRPSQSIP